MITWNYIISEKCNMNCNYCHINKNDDNHLKDEEYNFDIFGGEPLLWLLQIQYILDFLIPDNKCKKINITTNGTINPFGKIPDLLHKKVNITISHDGFYQNSQRGENSLKYPFGKNTKIHCMLTGIMFEESKPNILIENTKLFMFDDIILDMTLVRDRYHWNPEQVIVFDKFYLEYIDYFLNQSTNKFSEIPGLIRIYLSSFLDKVINEQNKTTCAPSKNTLSVSGTSGGLQVSACKAFAKEPYLLPELTDFYTYDFDICRSCNIKNYCDRGCLFEQIKNKGPIIELCNIYKIIFKHLKYLMIKKPELIYLFKEGK